MMHFYCAFSEFYLDHRKRDKAFVILIKIKERIIVVEDRYEI